MARIIRVKKLEKAVKVAYRNADEDTIPEIAKMYANLRLAA